MSESTNESEQTHVTLVFNRAISDEEVRQMQEQHDAVSALATSGGHHDHDHPKFF